MQANDSLLGSMQINDLGTRGFRIVFAFYELSSPLQELASIMLS